MKDLIIGILMCIMIVGSLWIISLNRTKEQYEFNIALNKTFADGFIRGQQNIIMQQTINRELVFFQDNRTQKISIDRLCGG